MTDAIRPAAVFDLDGTLYDFLGGLEKWVYDRTGVQLDLSNLPSPGLDQVSEDPAVLDVVYGALKNANFYLGLRPYPGAADAVARLARQGFLPVAVSSRPRPFVGVSVSALTRDFGVLFDVYRVFHCKWTSKPRRARMERARVAFEDHAATAEAYARAGVRTWLISHSYNDGAVERPSLRRADSIGDAVDQVLEIVAAANTA